MQPMPVLKNLTIHVDGSWSLTLPNLLRMTPKLTSLCLRGETTDQVLSLPTEIWPKLDNLTTLSVEHHRGGLLTTLPHAMLPLCGNLRTFNLKLLSLTLSDMGNFKIYVQPIRTDRNIENVSIDCPGEDVDNVALYDELFSELDDADEEEYTDEVEDSKWLGMKRLNVTGDYVAPYVAPSVASLETFRMTTMVQLKDQEYTEEISCGTKRPRFGYLPSRTTTGGLTEETVHTITECVPSLTLFEVAYNDSPDPFAPNKAHEMLQFLNVQTFVDGKNALVHCWTTADCGLFRFGPHDSRCDPDTRLDSKAYLPEDGAIEHGYNFSPYNVPERVDPFDPVVVTSTSLTGPFEFTYFRGFQLPFVLLDYVYSQIDVERMPTRGQRGLSMPSHVWQVLNDWHDEVRRLVLRSLEYE